MIDFGAYFFIRSTFLIYCLSIYQYVFMPNGAIKTRIHLQWVIFFLFPHNFCTIRLCSMRFFFWLSANRTNFCNVFKFLYAVLKILFMIENCSKNLRKYFILKQKVCRLYSTMFKKKTHIVEKAH